MLTSLVANFAVVGLFISAWAHALDWLQNLRPFWRKVSFGVLIGAGAIASMLLSAELQKGIFFDLRFVLVATAGFLGGPLSGLVTGLIAAATRFALGGDGMLSGVLQVAMATLVGLAGYYGLHGKTPTIMQSLMLAVTGAATPVVAILALPAAARDVALNTVAVPMFGVGILATFVAIRVIVQSRHRMETRVLLTAALKQAPNYAYVKDRDSRFMVVNQAVAEIGGFDDPNQMRGHSDFDVVDPERASMLFESEQQIMATGVPLAGLEELVETKDGKRWFSTSKVALHNSDGEVIGLAGTTRDVTERKALEAALVSSRDQLSFALTEMSDGLAVFDQSGHIILCNDQYRAMFPRTADLRVEGGFLPTILLAAIERGEQIGIPPDQVKAWIAGIMGSLKTGQDEEIHLFDGRWLHVRTKPVSGGKATVVVSDISGIKQSELKLVEATEQLKLLASTDGLTGLLNRRTFDDQLGKELSRARRGGLPVSVVLIDVDRFKAFNDLYGHPAGDECLRRVAKIAQQTAKRPADLVARYGGEEFCAILPETDEEGAYFLAEALRIAVRDACLEHHGSEKGIVTISAGVASFDADDTTSSALELVSRADEALYIAKGAGRDRVMGWAKRHEKDVHVA